jgi:small-conductance mechanosensitive channel
VASLLLTLPRQVARTFETVLLSVFILSTTVWVAKLVSRLLELRGGGAGGAATASATGVVRTMVKIAVLAVGGLVLLGTLGISITPVLTTMGLGGLAVALGLQETLSNLFAGMQITLAGHISVGDFIKLQSGEEGYVEDIHWRVTRMRTLLDSVVVVPNSQLAQTIVTNYHLPSKEVSILVSFGVHVNSDLEHVERVIRGVARGIVREVQGGVPEFDPLVRYHAFGESSIDLKVIFRVREFADQLLVQHELIKALVRELSSEGIVVPYPVRAINLEQERPRAARTTQAAAAGTHDAPTPHDGP